MRGHQRFGDVDRDAAELASRLAPSVVEVRAGSGVGAGTIWRPDGLIVTNDHVVPFGRAEIRLADGRTAVGQVLARDPRNDLAVIEVGLGGLPAVEIRRDAVRPGELVHGDRAPVRRAPRGGARHRLDGGRHRRRVRAAADPGRRADRAGQLRRAAGGRHRARRRDQRDGRRRDGAGGTERTWPRGSCGPSSRGPPPDDASDGRHDAPDGRRGRRADRLAARHRPGRPRGAARGSRTASRSSARPSRWTA